MFALLESEVQREHALDRDGALEKVVETAASLVRAQPGMAPLLNLSSSVVAASAQAVRADDVTKSAREAAERFLVRAKQAAIEAQSHAARLIQDGATVLTHSRSSTVENAVTAASRGGRRLQVIATESRPMLEGRTLAETLAREAIRVALIADSAAALVMDRVDLVLVGADCITPHHVVNKIGTRMIALAAGERRVPVYVLCDTSKFVGLDDGLDSHREERRAAELWRAAPAGVDVMNRYFEPTPVDLFAAIVTETGVLTPSLAARQAAAVSLHRLLVDRLTD
ncbi:MAG TPA: hypothetical protein VJH03_24835 [Blastocatellia bacterium]|nr:hypothetical protein [Blastocatellia bacterium]